MPAPAVTTEAPFNAQFKVFAAELDAANEKRERLVKASRDVTAASKKLIFHLHRANTNNHSSVIESANQSIKSIRTIIASRILPELDPESYHRFHNAYSPGLQEYVEARSFLQFLTSHTLVTPQQIQQELRQTSLPNSPPHTNTTNFILHNSDYILGIADLTGELMRTAVAAAARSDPHAVSTIWRFMRALELGLKALRPSHGACGRDFPQKMRVLQNNIAKVEKSSCDLAVRAAEFRHPATRSEKRNRELCIDHVADQPPAKRRVAE